MVVLVAPVVGAGSLVVRFRRARGAGRQQLRWLALGAALASVALVIALTAELLAVVNQTVQPTQASL